MRHRGAHPALTALPRLPRHHQGGGHRSARRLRRGDQSGSACRLFALLLGRVASDRPGMGANRRAAPAARRRGGLKSPRTRERGHGSQPKAPAAQMISAATKQHQGHRSASAHPCQADVVARGVYGPPAGRRTLGAIVVPSCPFCGYLHLHRSTVARGGHRMAGCGREYVVVLAGPTATLGKCRPRRDIILLRRALP